jgi:tetratricopeptide (TPR) repeat protein
VEGWVALGERAYHDHGQVLLPPSTYRNAFSKAIQLNPHYREPYLHLIEDAFFRLDSAGARRLIEEYAAIDSSRAGCTNQLAFDLVWASDATRERALAALDTIPPSVIWSGCLPSVGPFPAPPRVLDKLRMVYQAIADTASEPRSTLLAFYNLHLRVLAPRGQIAAIQRTLVGMEGVTGPAGWWVERWQIMLHLSDFPDSLAAHRAAKTLVENAHPFAGFWLGILAGAEGRWADADRSGRALDRRAQDLATVGDTAGASAVRAHVTALRAYLDFARGDRSRLEDLELALRQLPPRAFAPPEAYLRYQAGKLLFERGQLRDAERYFLSFGPIGFYTSQAELYLGRISEALGRPDDALEHYRRFIAWWQYADPSLRGPLEEARAALRRLTRGQDN